MSDELIPHDPNAIAHPLQEEPTVVTDTSSVRMHATPEGVATVTINRPAKKNALDAETIEALRQAFETLKGEDGVRLVFLRGEGGSFCAGADVEWMRRAGEQTEADNRADAMNLARMLKALHDLPQLTVALVEGAAYGGGAGLIAACDMAVATAGARVALSEAKIGLTPATISPYVVRAVGPRNARRLFAMANWFDAAEAFRVGLVDQVVADGGELDAVRDRLAADIMAVAPGAMADAKRLVEDVAFRPIDHALMEDTARRIAARRASAEGREGLAAFLEKRRPAWQT
jgi:methylglutaconyl-CoA hydratase